MKIIDAVWEKRNLGLNCIEINVDKDDSIQQLSSVLEKYNEEYMVVRVPDCKTDFYKMLMQEKFCFMEAMIHVENNISDYSLRSYQKKAAKNMQYVINNLEGRKRVYSHICNGLFDTDRISLDKIFKAGQAAQRYIGMIEDEMLRGAELMEFFIQDRPFGFSCFRKINSEVYYQSLVGLYSDFHKAGYGFAIAYLPIKELLKRGVKLLTSAVSTNNLASFRTHMNSGFLPTKVEYIFVKHKL